MLKNLDSKLSVLYANLIYLILELTLKVVSKQLQVIKFNFVFFVQPLLSSLRFRLQKTALILPLLELVCKALLCPLLAHRIVCLNLVQPLVE